MERGPNCLKCKYYFVTWDPSASHGCKVFGFKSNLMPSLRVFQTTGTKCPSFMLSDKLSN